MIAISHDQTTTTSQFLFVVDYIYITKNCQGMYAFIKTIYWLISCFDCIKNQVYMN